MKYKNYIFAVLLVVMGLCTGYISGYQKHVEKSEQILQSVESSKDSVKAKLDSVKVVEKRVDSTKKSRDYIKYMILKETGMTIPKSLPDNHLNLMYKQAKDKGIPLKVLFRMVYLESEFKATARNASGAKGYFQLMPDTYRKYCKKLGLAVSPVSNILIGTYYLKEMYNYWNKKPISEEKKWRLALASYNAGIARVIKHQGVPPITETRKYVAYILKQGI